jgi:hypothetical protein
VCFCILAWFVQYANRIISAPFTVICDLSGCTIFFPHYLINDTIFGGWGWGGGGGREIIELKVCFDFSYNFCLKYFLFKEEFSEKLQTREPGLRRRYSAYGKDWTVRASKLGRGKRFFCFQNRAYRLCGAPGPVFYAYRVSVPGVTLTDLTFWCWPLICIYFRGQKWVEFCLYSACLPLMA